MNLYPQDFDEPPGFLSLLTLVAYLKLNFAGSDMEHQAQRLLSEFQHIEADEAGTEGEEDSGRVTWVWGGEGRVWATQRRAF